MELLRNWTFRFTFLYAGRGLTTICVRGEYGKIPKSPDMRNSKSKSDNVANSTLARTSTSFAGARGPKIRHGKMVRVFVVGVGMTKFEKPGKRADDYPDWGKEAITAALDDARVKMSEVELATAGYVYGDSTSGQRVIYEVGMTGIPIFNVNNNCSTGSSALMLAKELVESGKYDCALAVGFEKMERGSLSSKFNDRTNPMDKHVEAMADLATLAPAPVTAQMFGNAAIEHMKKYGTRPEHFAKIAYKNHKHSVNNPKSQFRDEYSLKQILDSPQIFGPLTKLQCCPTSDGAAAAILVSERFVRSHGLESQAVEILGMEMSTDLPSTFLEQSHMKIVGYDMSKHAADRLYRKTNKNPGDVQVVELHDCFSANELITYEALGLCPPGGAGAFIDRGDNTYGGKYVVNPSGGLISKGHPLGATGLAQCAELCWQLRGEAGPRQVPRAQLALQHNIGLGGAVVVALYQLGFPEYRNRNIAILQQAMDEDEDGLIEKHRAIYGLKVVNAKGETGFWVINCKTGKGKIEFNGKDKPDVTFIVKDSDVMELLTGKIPPQKAFFPGSALFLIMDSYAYTSAPYTGPSNQSEAYFNGSSYVRLQTTISLKKQTGLSFRTCYGGSLFSQQQNDDLIELSVDTDGIVFLARTDGKTYDFKILGNFLNNHWHTVFLQYRLGNLTIDVDGETHLIANSSFRNDLLVSPGLYNEGAAVPLIGKHFNGCLLEGPSIVFDATVSSSHNVVFGPCPIPYDSCIPRERIAGFDYCLTEPCMRHGTCVSGQNSYTCVCLPRYTGKNCEIDLGNPCEKTPPVCKNSGTCKAEPVGDFTCVCATGFTGKRCEHELKVHPLCSHNPCLNGGSCDYDFEEDQVECHCKSGFAGQNCEINIDECTPNPCLSGGVCTDGFNNFTCDCSHTGYKGRICEVNINECLANPCLNQGNLFRHVRFVYVSVFAGFRREELPIYTILPNVDECSSQPCFNNGICVSRSGGYECRCLPDFLGDHCEIEQGQQRQCDPTSCPPYADCVDTGSTLACACKPEYPGEYPNCNVDTMCANNPCTNGGICTPFKGSYNCTCLPGFAGPACEFCDASRCKNNTFCTNQPSIANCMYADEWPGVRTCGTQSRCVAKPCQHATACQDYLGGYYCTCEPGWTGLNCDILVGLCSNHPCPNHSTCHDNGSQFFCLCPPGLKGRICQIDIDECASNPCMNGGSCIDKVNSFLCQCPDQWMGTVCEKPYDVCELHPVSPDSRGETCETNIDDCEDASCPPGKVCVDLVNNYECQCPPGFAGKDCSTDVDPCAKEPCHNGTCVVTDSVNYKFTCDCDAGFAGTVPFCNQDIDECVLSPKICNHGICFNTIGSFQCYCQPGFTGEHCNLDFDECLSMPCRNNATCINQINNYECRCPPGYEGKECSQNIDECLSSPCKWGSTCIDGINEFTCLCPAGLTGKLCETNIDDCESSPCQNRGQCLDGLDMYTCDCTDTGYEGSKITIVTATEGTLEKNCEIDINECESNPCQFNGTCLERSNQTLYNESLTSQFDIELPESFDRPFNYSDAFGYECLCVPGVTGQNCEININECESNPCYNGVCSDKIGGTSASVRKGTRVNTARST
ncbi:hypothetical protein NQ317_004546 [Molorchus minor]|uniref:Sterol carrier protein 2 n=1 Tax=Molorchus minor TaxID=1323400 RepID=A0ABQ9JIG6_9CUCU|nr:hypothetical protein NQ317_004546 [Molorchus minor]